MHLLIKTIALAASVYFQVSCLHAQRGPLRFRSPFKGFPTDTIQLQTTGYIPDSSRVSLAEIRFCLKKGKTESSLSLALTNTGGILAFTDSLLTTAQPLEKRSAFPFTPFRPNRPYILVYTPSPGPGDFLAFRLLDSERNEVLDEVYLCSFHPPVRISFLSSKAWILAK